MIRRWSLRIEKFVQWQLPFIWLISPVSHGNPTDDQIDNHNEIWILDSRFWNSNAESVRFHIRVFRVRFYEIRLKMLCRTVCHSVAQ